MIASTISAQVWSQSLPSRNGGAGGAWSIKIDIGGLGCIQFCATPPYGECPGNFGGHHRLRWKYDLEMRIKKALKLRHGLSLCLLQVVAVYKDQIWSSPKPEDCFGGLFLFRGPVWAASRIGKRSEPPAPSPSCPHRCQLQHQCLLQIGWKVYVAL